VKLEKLTFTPMSKDLKTKFDAKAFKVLFNPNSYSITKTVTWNQTGAPAAAPAAQAGAVGNTQRYLDAPTLNFGGGGSRNLTLNLFFDVTETPGKDVRSETGKIVELTKKDRDQKCPLPCEISWGAGGSSNSDFPFVGVITSLTQNFVFFGGDGIPLRANLTVVMTEYPDPEKNQRQTDPEFTTRVVRRGDTLSSITAEVYGDPSLWRIIAEANGLDDPRRLEVGGRLTIPKTR
jgi:nucleoid-associated protein YgaU